MIISCIRSRIRSLIDLCTPPPSRESKKKALTELATLSTRPSSNGSPNARDLLAAIKELAPQGPFVFPQPPVSCIAFQGGGGRGRSYSGVSSALEEQGITSQVHTVAGSSAGAITAFLFAMGCNSEQFQTMAHKLDLQDLLDPEGSYEAAIWTNYVYSGKNFHSWARMICQEMLGNADATFGDLHAAISDSTHPYHHPELKHLIVTATQLLEDESAKTTVISSRDRNSWKIKIADAIRASMSIPGIYQPWEIIDTNGYNHGVFFDGGILLNFPIDLLDKNEYTQTHLGLQYPLVESESGADLFHINPCSIGFTFVDDLNRLNKTITPLTPHLSTLCEQRGVVFDPQIPSIPSNSIGPIQVGHLIRYAFYGQRTTEELTAKAKRHPGNVIQLFPEGIGMMDFSVSKEQIERAVLTAKESTLLQLQQKRKTERYTGKKPKVCHLKLDNYLEALALEVRSNENIIDQEQFKQNCTLQFLAQKIMATIKTLKEKSKYQYEADETILETKIIKFQQKRQLLQNRDKRLQNILDNEKIAEKLQLLLQDRSTEKNQQFMIHFEGNLTNVIELSFQPIPSQEGRTLLQQAIYTGNTTLLEAMLKTVETAYRHRQKQKKEPSLNQTFGDLINRAAGGLLRSLCEAPLDKKEQLQILDILLQQHDCNPSEELEDAVTPLHIAIETAIAKNNYKIFYRLIEHTSGGYFYRRSYRTFEGIKESLFEYILRKADPKFLLKILNNEEARRKVFHYKHICESGFSMQELLADYSRNHPESDIWKWFYDKDLVNNDYLVQLKAFDEKK